MHENADKNFSSQLIMTTILQHDLSCDSDLLGNELFSKLNYHATSAIKHNVEAKVEMEFQCKSREEYGLLRGNHGEKFSHKCEKSV